MASVYSAVNSLQCSEGDISWSNGVLESIKTDNHNTPTLHYSSSPLTCLLIFLYSQISIFRPDL